MQPRSHDQGGDDGHGHTTAGEWLSMGLWSGLALVLVAALVLGLLLGARVIRRRAARQVPCGNCGVFFDPAEDPVCPACGRSPGPAKPGGGAEDPQA